MAMSINENLIFALDIGTRTVIGVVCKKEGNVLKVIAQSVIEHDSRSMIDGQVHDIDKVADVVIKVKQELETKVGFPLREVAIAAAGRALKTRCVHVEQDLGDEMDIDSTIINSLELSGVSEAKSQIGEEIRYGEDTFYCVGYSTVSYYLNNYSITNLLNHKGRHVAADVLATFLPQSVVSSLYKVLDICGLKPVSLTLEPIAAIEAVVPENIRLINVVLVDIGAGTSDIAIAKRGSIVAYSMVPVAGDEITETIADGYLVDFNTAETIKRSINKKKKIIFKDIMGNKNTVSSIDVLQMIDGTVQRLGEEISKAIIHYNKDAPKAVFCVGGGSQTPNLIDDLAAKLNIDKNRIVIKKRNSIMNLESCDKLLDGPEGVTVIGIALVAFKKIGHDFINVIINGKEHRIFNSGDLTLCEVLGLIGYNPSFLIARGGKRVKFTLNGEVKRINGAIGIPPEITINSVPANLDTMVSNEDLINIKDACSGRDATPRVKDYLYGYGAVSYILNGVNITIEPECMLNGKAAEFMDIIKDGDTMIISVASTILLQSLKHNISIDNMNIFVNGKNAKPDYIIMDGDKVVIRENSAVDGLSVGTLGNAVMDSNSVLDNHSSHTKDNTVMNGNKSNIKSNIIEDFIYNKEFKISNVAIEKNVTIGNNRGAANNITVLVNGKNVVLQGLKHIFVDIFSVIDFDLSKPKGNVKLLINGRNAQYSEPIKDGEVIEVSWE